MAMNKRQAKFLATTEFIAREQGHALRPWFKRRYDQIATSCSLCEGTVNVVVRKRTHFGEVINGRRCHGKVTRTRQD